MRLLFFTRRPSIRTDQRAGVLVVRTGFLQAALTLFMNLRRVEVSLPRRTVTVSRRLAYFFSSRDTIDFDDVWYLDYSFAASGVKWGLTDSGFDECEQNEAFSISIVTRDENVHPVCVFNGYCSVDRGWVGTMIGDQGVAFSGGQESESGVLAGYLAGLLGVKIGAPLEEVAEMIVCRNCGHPTAPRRPKCLYCGTVVSG